MSKCISDLEDGKLNAALKAHYIKVELTTHEGDSDPVVAGIDRSLAPQRAIRFGHDFDERCERMIEAWRQVEDGPTFAKCRAVRNNLVAHTRLAGPDFEPIDIRKLGIDFTELKPAIDLMQELIEQLGGLIHSTGYAWGQLERTVTTAADDFWGVAGLSLNQIVWQGGIRSESS
jgi:hypothetical protein